jgi:hypothetical protein
MSGRTDDDGRTGGAMTPSNDESHTRRPIIEGTVVRYADKPDECTLHPAMPTSKESTTTWITAKEGSYVSVMAWR